MPVCARSGISHRRSGPPPAARRWWTCSVSGARVKAADRQPETVLEIQTADLAVGHDVQPNGFLQRHQLANARELDVCKRRRTEFAGIETRPRLQPCGRPQQAADDIGSDAM